MKRLTYAQQRVLENLRDGKLASAGISGQSAFGGLTRTLWSLRRAKLITLDERRLEPALSYAKEAVRRAKEDGIVLSPIERLEEFERLLRWHNADAFARARQLRA